MYDTDPYEELRIEKELRIYAIFASILTTIAFGKSTSTFLTTMLSVVDDNNAQQLIELFEYPALVVILAAFGSCGVNWFTARQKKRSGFVWAVKGFMGGPLSIIQLRNLDDLQQLSSE